MLVVLKCVVFRAFWSVLLSFSVFSPPSLLLIIIVSIIIVLISPLKSQFSMMGFLAGAGCGSWGSWLGWAGFWGVLVTWVRGSQLQPVGS